MIHGRKNYIKSWVKTKQLVKMEGIVRITETYQEEKKSKLIRLEEKIDILD